MKAKRKTKRSEVSEGPDIVTGVPQLGGGICRDLVLGQDRDRLSQKTRDLLPAAKRPGQIKTYERAQPGLHSLSPHPSPTSTTSHLGELTSHLGGTSGSASELALASESELGRVSYK